MLIDGMLLMLAVGLDEVSSVRLFQVAVKLFSQPKKLKPRITCG